jgi:hypothetical protein
MPLAGNGAAFMNAAFATPHENTRFADAAL